MKAAIGHANFRWHDTSFREWLPFLWHSIFLIPSSSKPQCVHPCKIIRKIKVKQNHLFPATVWRKPYRSNNRFTYVMGFPFAVNGAFIHQKRRKWRISQA